MQSEASLEPNVETVTDGEEVGHWHLDTVVTDWDPVRRLMDPLPQFGMGDQTADNPREYEGDIVAPNDQTKIEFDPHNTYLCGLGGAPAGTNPCVFVDWVSLFQITDQKIHYHARNHGGRCGISLLIYWRGLVKTAHSGPEQKWRKGASFLVFVPANALDATVIGKMGEDDILFTPSKPLEGDDAKRFKLIQTKTVDGIGTYYTFIVVNPFPNS